MTPMEISDTFLRRGSTGYRSIDLADGRPILSVIGGGHANPFKPEEMAEITIRAIACWNACRGFPTSELEPEMLEKQVIEGALHVAALEARLAAALKDAERYHWFRAAWVDGADTGDDSEMLPALESADTEAEVDAAIDAALAEVAQQGGAA